MIKSFSLLDLMRILGVPPNFPQPVEVRIADDCYEPATLINIDQQVGCIVEYSDGQQEAGVYGPDEIFVVFK